MTKKEIKELQDSLLVLIPNNVKDSKELTRSDKILLGNLYLLYGLDKAKTNGYVYRSNDLLIEDTKLSKPTIITSINHLISLDFITRSTGNRIEGASVYTLNFEVINSFNKGKNIGKIKGKICEDKGKIKGKISNENLTDNLTYEIEALRLEIKELKGLIVGLMGKISDKGKISNLTTDPDTDIEKEIIINNTTSGPIEENNDIVVEDTTNDNDIETLDSLLNTDNVIEVNGTTIRTFIPTNEGLFIPEYEDTTNDITSTDTGFAIADIIEVCDSDEQREEEITNDINENKQQVEMRSAENLTSTDGDITTTNTHFNEEVIIISSNGDNETPFNSNSQGYKAPQPPTKTENANKAVLSHENNADNKNIHRSDKTQQEANKVANLGCFECGDKYAEVNAIFESVKSNLTNGTDESELDDIFLPIFQLIQSQTQGDYEILDYIADEIDSIIGKIQNWFDSDKIDIIINTAIRLLGNKK